MQWATVACLVCMAMLSFLPVQAKTEKVEPGTATTEHIVDSLCQQAFELKRKDVVKAFALLHEAARLAQKCHYKKGEITSIIYKAGIYEQNGYSKRALSLYSHALVESQATKDTLNIARATQQIGNALIENNQLDKAEKNYEMALAKYISLKRWDDVVNIKNSLGLLKLHESEYAKAEMYLMQALQESEKNQYPYGFKKANFHLGLVYLKAGDLVKARSYFNNSLAIDLANHDTYGLSLARNKLALVSSLEGKHKEAVTLAKAALQDARFIHAAKLEAEAMQNLVIVYKAKKDYPTVVEWQDSLITKEKELFNREKEHTFNFIDILKQKQEQQLASEKKALVASQQAKVTYYALAFMVVILMAFVAIAYLWYRSYLKARTISCELAAKNEVIEENSKVLDRLNKNITRQYESLEEANQMKDKLLSILSHDLKTPLANTKGILQLINGGFVREEQYKPVLLELEKQYVGAMALLENLLFWIKKQMKGDVIKPENIYLRTLLEDVIKEQEVAAQHKNITIYNEVDPGVQLQGDPELLKVVFRNLISNSVKFTAKEGNVTVSAQVEKELLVKIADQGIGISKEMLAKIKHKSYFTTKGTNNERGSGFGLMICEELINRHGGEVLVESEVNKGSVFMVKLPASVVLQSRSMVA